MANVRGKRVYVCRHAWFGPSTEIGQQKSENNIVITSSKRTRKNVQSRARAAQLRSKIEEIKRKPEEEQTEDEIKTLKLFEGRREKKERSRERAVEKKVK